jgi:hypothetical protein
MALVNSFDVLSYYGKKARKLRRDLDTQNVAVTLGNAVHLAGEYRKSPNATGNGAGSVDLLSIQDEEVSP